MTYDQLSITQWVRGFCQKLLEEKSEKWKDVMIVYLIELLEDTTEFMWENAKASHTVLVCVFLSVQALGGSVPLAPTLSSWASVFGFILGGIPVVLVTPQ